MPSANRKQISQFIKKQRQSLGWSQREFGRRLGCPQATVQQWESGKTTPDTENIAKIANLLGLQLSQLFALIEGESVAAPQMIIYDKNAILVAFENMSRNDLVELGSMVMQKLAQTA